MKPGTPCLLGVETEYGIAVLEAGTDATPAPCMRREALTALLEAARASPALPGYGATGLFLANGARFYIETGHHVEYATPECPDPWALAAHVRAGEKLLRTWADAAGASLGVDVRILCHNVDVADFAISWGCHESYLIRDCLKDEALIRNLAPHLATRIIYAGAGGIGRNGRFVLSPRATVIVTVDSHSTMHSRGLLDLFRQKSWSAGGYRRIHLCCGDTNRMQAANVLKTGSTALLLILLQNGIEPEAGLRLSRPLDALHALNGDPALTAPLATSAGPCSALHLQRGLLQLCERHLGESFMPPWAVRFCALWGSALDRLAASTAPGLLEWPTKWALLQERGIAEPSRRTHAGAVQMIALNPRFAMLDGILDQLDAAGVIEHVLANGAAEKAMRVAPPGRAAVRGEAIAHCAPSGLANWGQVIDRESALTADLSDPIAPAIRWTPFDTRRLAHRYSGTATTIAQLDFQHGNCRAVGLHFDGDLDLAPDELLETLFRAASEAGDHPRALEVLRHIESRARPDVFSPALRVLLHCNAGIVPAREALAAFEAIAARESAEPGGIDPETACLGGRVFLALGQPARARQLLLTAASPDVAISNREVWIRATARLADASRSLGDCQRALHYLRLVESAAITHDNGLHAADHVLPCLAKARAENPPAARALLRRAADIQCRLDHPFGFARTLLLEARVCGPSLSQAARRALDLRLRSLLPRVPALRMCPRVALILNNLTSWFDGDAYRHSSDRFLGI